MNEVPEYGTSPDATRLRRPSPLRALAWLEWRRHRFGAITAIVCLAPVIALTAAVEPAREGMFLWLVLALAISAGTGVGRVEWFEGEEEFQLTLPATRTQRYWVKLAAGALVLLAVYTLGAVACLTEWLAPLWDALAVREYGSDDLPPWVGRGPDAIALAFTMPVAAYVECFALATCVSRRGEAGWVWRLLLFVAGTALVLFAAHRWLEGRAVLVYAPAFLGHAVWRAFSGARRYAGKDAVLDVQAVGGQERVRVVLMVVLGLLTLLGLFAWFLVSRWRPG